MNRNLLQIVFLLLILPTFVWGQGGDVAEDKKDDGMTERDRYLKKFMVESDAKKMINKAKEERVKQVEAEDKAGREDQIDPSVKPEQKMGVQKIEGLLKKVLGGKGQDGDPSAMLKALKKGREGIAKGKSEQQAMMRKASEAIGKLNLKNGAGGLDMKKLQGMMKAAEKGEAINPEDMSGLADSALGFFRSKSQPEVEQFLRDKFNGSPLGSFLESNPRVTRFSASVMRDKKALPGFIKTYAERTKPYMFFGFVILSIIMGKLWKRFQLKRSDVTIGGEFKGFFVRSIALLILRFVGFFGIFQAEMRPFIGIFKSTFL